MNNCVFIGRLTRDVELKQTESGFAIATYGIAVKRQFAKPGTQDVDFLNIKALGRAAEFVEKWFKKGDMIAVTGSYQIDRWETDGEKKEFHHILVNGQEFCGDNKGSNDYKDNAQSIARNAMNPTAGFKLSDEDDDLPF